jgi:hypothetical protein
LARLEGIALADCTTEPFFTFREARAPDFNDGDVTPACNLLNIGPKRKRGRLSLTLRADEDLSRRRNSFDVMTKPGTMEGLNFNGDAAIGP